MNCSSNGVNNLPVCDSLKERARDDIERFSKLHSWYRHLPYEGVEYLLFPWKGQQPRNAIETKVDDTDKWHWWIWEAAFIDEIPIDGFGKDIIMRHAVKFNCFLRGLEGEFPNIHLRGMYVIRIKNPGIEDILYAKYKARLSSEGYAALEYKHQISLAIDAAHKIYDLMKESSPEWLSPIINSMNSSGPSEHVEHVEHVESDPASGGTCGTCSPEILSDSSLPSSIVQRSHSDPKKLSRPLRGITNAFHRSSSVISPRYKDIKRK